MRVFNKLSEAKRFVGNSVTAVALGTFDGIHIGHQSIINKAIELAGSVGGTSVVFSFSNHPLSVLAPERAPLLIGDNISKVQAIEELGAEVLINIPFTEKLSKQSPEMFLQLLRDNLHPMFVVTGPNFSFGCRGKGNPRLLKRIGNEYGFQTEIADGVSFDGHLVSSTRIREMIADGRLEEANEYLGRLYSFGGIVSHGDHRGRKLGFPTANLPIVEGRAMLPNGAYAVYVLVKGRRYMGIANVGNNPTFEGCSRRVEVYILDFNEDIYGSSIEVRFKAKLRDEKKFPGVEALITQLHRDEEKARSILIDG